MRHPKISRPASSAAPHPAPLAAARGSSRSSSGIGPLWRRIVVRSGKFAPGSSGKLAEPSGPDAGGWVYRPRPACL